MATGCTGPFVYGTGGWCGCNCKCCPPSDMVTCVSITFGPPAHSVGIVEESYSTATERYGLILPEPPQEMPTFDKNPILSEDKQFLFGGPAQTCSVPCQAFNVMITPSSPSPVCGFQVLNNCTFRAVGNGYVKVAPITHDVPDCGTIKMQINGHDSPVFVTDGSTITVSLVYEDPWNSYCCACIEVCPMPCMSMAGNIKSILRYKTAGGKMKINPTTGLPIVVVDKEELMKRIIERRQRLRRKKQ